MFVSDTIHNAQYIHNLFFPHDDGPNLIKHNTSTWPQLIWWFDHSFLYSYSSYCILYYCPKYIEVSPPKPSGSSDDCLPLHPVISCELLELIFKFCSNNGKRKIFIRPKIPSYSSAAAAQRKTSLSTSTTSNPCRADWPVNCCNLKSRGPDSRTGVLPCVLPF